MSKALGYLADIFLMLTTDVLPTCCDRPKKLSIDIELSEMRQEAWPRRASLDRQGGALSCLGRLGHLHVGNDVGRGMLHEEGYTRLPQALRPHGGAEVGLNGDSRRPLTRRFLLGKAFLCKDLMLASHFGSRGSASWLVVVSAAMHEPMRSHILMEQSLKKDSFYEIQWV